MSISSAETLELTKRIKTICMATTSPLLYLELVRRTNLQPKCLNDQINIWAIKGGPMADVIKIDRMGDNWWNVRCVASRKAVLEYAIEREAELLKMEGVLDQ